MTWTAEGRPPSEMKEVYDEWMEVGGIRVPKKILLNRGGARYEETVLREFALNPGLTLEEIGKRP